jgi:short-subunit dehydrogenase
MEAHQELTAKAISFIGRIDIIIHSAGVTQRSLAENTEMHVYRTLMEINFFAPVSLSKQILPHFTQNQSGHIVVISSMAGLMGFPKRTGYAAAKHALKGYFETLQTENSVRGISVTIAYPGRINTPISTNALLGDGGKHGKMDKGQLNGIPVNVCAAKIIRAIKLKKKKVIIAQGERLLFWFWWFLPALYHRIAQKTGMKDDTAK